MIHFDDVKQLTINFVKNNEKQDSKYYILRDVFGKISLYLVGEENVTELQRKLVAVIGQNWFASAKTIDSSNPLFKEIESSVEKVSENIFYGERPLVKKIWGSVNVNKESTQRNSKIITFYSYKGGVGRTTTLVLTALSLVREGKRVIAVDFDLEAPGLGTLLKPED